MSYAAPYPTTAGSKETVLAGLTAIWYVWYLVLHLWCDRGLAYTEWPDLGHGRPALNMEMDGTSAAHPQGCRGACAWVWGVGAARETEDLH